MSGSRARRPDTIGAGGPSSSATRVGRAEASPAPTTTRVVLTGGAGFIGGHLARALLQRGHQVDVVDDLSHGRADAVPPGATLHVHDVRSTGWTGLIAGATRIFHLASPMGVRRAFTRGAEVVRAVLEAALVVADACRQAQVPLLYTSSSEAGTAANLGRRGSYGAAKLAAEHLFLASDAGLPEVHVARLFNVVGPGQPADEGHVLPSFAAAARQGRPLTVFGDGSSRRVFLHVDDAVEALLLLAETPTLAGSPIDVGGVEELSMYALAERVSTLAGGGSLVHQGFEQAFGSGFGEVARRVPELGPLRAQGWSPRRSVDEAILDALAAVP